MGAEEQRPTEPRGFGTRTRGLSSEYAHEQGWGLDEDERRKPLRGPQDTDGGKDYEYGARDFGDEPLSGARLAGEKGGGSSGSTGREAGTTREEEQE